MFWNLVRYEFKNVNKWYLALYAAVLVLSALIGIQTQTYNNLPAKESQLTMILFLATVFGWLGYRCHRYSLCLCQPYCSQFDIELNQNPAF